MREKIERALQSAKERQYRITRKGKVCKGITDKTVNQNEVMNVTVQALERLLPVKVNGMHKHVDHISGYCPKCYERLAQFGDTNYCNKCGTGLDWEIENDD